MELTFATSGDDELHEIIDIDPIAARDQARRNHLQSCISAGECLSVRHRGDLVAYALVTENFFHQSFLELLVVNPTHQRQGIGKQTLIHLSETFAAPHLWTSTNSSNTPMRSLLTQLAFEFCGTIHGLDEGDPEMIYRITKSKP